MSDQIEADYDQLEQVAMRFAMQAQATEQMLGTIRSRISNLENGGWIGLGADAFFAEMEGEVIPAIDRLCQVFQESARISRYSIQTLQQAEQEACSLFGVV